MELVGKPSHTETSSGEALGKEAITRTSSRSSLAV